MSAFQNYPWKSSFFLSSLSEPLGSSQLTMTAQPLITADSADLGTTEGGPASAPPMQDTSRRHHTGQAEALESDK